MPVGAAGAAGVVRGVPVAEELEALSPPEVTMRICTSYVVPFASPVMESGLVTDAGDRVVHEVPPSVEY